jgi:hypothetical protein
MEEIKHDTAANTIIVKIGDNSKPFICKKSAFIPLNWLLSTKNPVINIFKRKSIPIVINVDMSI